MHYSVIRSYLHLLSLDLLLLMTTCSWEESLSFFDNSSKFPILSDLEDFTNNTFLPGGLPTKFSDLLRILNEVRRFFGWGE